MTPADRSAVSEAALFELPARRGGDKLMSLGKAVSRFVRPGMVLHLCWSDARPNAAVMEIVRQYRDRKPGFTVSSVGLANNQAALVAAGVADRLTTAYAGESYPAGWVNALFKRAIDQGRVEIENWSQWTIVQRLMAGAQGLPFAVTRSLAGSELGSALEGTGMARLDNPFGPGAATVVAPLIPDIAILQGLAADEEGNVLMSPPFGESAWGALAAREGVIACVERIVSATDIRAHNSLVRIPGHIVKAVCEVPFGSHPYGSFSGSVPQVLPYVEDAAFIDMTERACRSDEEMGKWLDEWVSGVPDHAAYLEKLGSERLAELRAAADPERWRSEDISVRLGAAAFTPEEWMIVVAARRLAGRVLDAGHEVVLAGIGASNIASWLAEHKLREAGEPVRLISEIGIYGYVPRPGEPFVFSNRNIATASMLTDVSVTLGTLVSGRHNRCLGAIGAATVDAEGNIATVYGQDGGFIVGSGGANDIASAAAELIITTRHGRRRLVEKAAHVTSPGHAVRTIVTDRAVLQRAGPDQPFAIVAVLPREGETVARAVAAAKEGCSWPLAEAGAVAAEPAPDAHELELVRRFDPQGIFRGCKASSERMESK